ncbi:uncharacterized protein PRCAT00004236001 [Priceomyces carsonii]|uniref:uncharacterized protein n=1 Tax=Priceomyces carsonii TaxID=28549 RepID=UPI002EDAB11E|nr:unnamed protein product [Priceomyces carsonii]
MLQEVLLQIYSKIEQRPIEVSLALILVYSIYFFILYPFFLSPLRKIPGPYLFRISKVFALYGQWRHQWISTVYELHKQYGSIVLISPTEVSFGGDLKYVQDIYVNNFPKGSFYSQYKNHGEDNIFTSLNSKSHLKNKKLIMHLYSKSALLSSESSFRKFLARKIRTLVRQIHLTSVSGSEPDYFNAKSELNEFGKGHNDGGRWFNKSNKIQNLGIDVYSLFGSLSMDVITAFELGEKHGTNMLEQKGQRKVMYDHRKLVGMVFWTTLMPKFWNLAANKELQMAKRTVNEWLLNLYRKKEIDSRIQLEPCLSVFETLKKKGIQGNKAYSFLSDNIFAGHETTAVQLTYITYELSRKNNRSVVENLTKEIVQTFGKPLSEDDIIDDFEKVDKLEYLNAIVQENLRVHSSIPGAEPRVASCLYRVTLESGDVASIPKGTVVSCLPYSLHRQSRVFPNPQRFLPERWLRNGSESKEQYLERVKIQQKFMMPFGKGIRMCLGMNIALLEIKLTLVNLYWRFYSRVCEDWASSASYSPEEKLPHAIDITTPQATEGSNDEEKMRMVDLRAIRPLHDECWLEWYDNESRILLSF